MVEVGKKYRLNVWDKGKWVTVLMVDGDEFWGKDQNGRRSTWLIDRGWIEIKQRPRTLLDCHKAGMAGDEKQFGPRMVVPKGHEDQVSPVVVRGAEKFQRRFAVYYQSDHGRDVIQLCGTELSDWLVWPIEMTNE